MSAQWEVVGKSNKKVNVPTKKLTKTDKKKFVETAPKIEDVLPLDQIRTLYNALDGSKENKKPQPTVKEPEKKPKKKAPVATDKKDPAAKEKVVPKSLEIAAKQLNVKELVSVVELNRARFPESPMLWMKGVAEFLNARLAHCGPTGPARPQDAFLCLLPAEARDVLHKAAHKPGPAVARHFFELGLSAMVAEMSKGNTSVTGYKVMLQLVAPSSASEVLENPGKVRALWNSFQNKQPIGTAILWSLVQLGTKDLAVGLTVWLELVRPMLELRNYGSFAVGHLRMLSTAVQRGRPLPVAQLVGAMDAALADAPGLPPALRRELHEAASLLLKKAVESKPENKLRSLFPPLLERLDCPATKSLEKDLLSALLACLKTDSKCYHLWQKLYTDNVDASARLLQFIRHGHWRELNARPLRETLASFQAAGEGLSDDTGAAARARAVCQEILPKLQMPVKKKSFPWKLGSALLTLAIAALLAFDVHRHGSFEASSTGLFLRDAGVPGAVARAGEALGAATSWARPHVLDALSYLGATGRGAAEYVGERAPLLRQWFDAHAPWLLEAAGDGWRAAVDAAGWLGDAGARQSKHLLAWARDNVFVGRLSPEKLQQFSQEALNTTQAYAVRTYQWVVDKYHTLTLATVH